MLLLFVQLSLFLFHSLSLFYRLASYFSFLNVEYYRCGFFEASFQVIAVDILRRALLWKHLYICWVWNLFSYTSNSYHLWVVYVLCSLSFNELKWDFLFKKKLYLRMRFGRNVFVNDTSVTKTTFQFTRKSTIADNTCCFVGEINVT